MKIIILHGDNYIESYIRLKKFIDISKSRGWDIEKISDNSKNLQETLVSDSLFQKQRIVILEDADIITKKTADWINKISPDISVNLIIYHKGILNQTFLKQFLNAKIEEYKMPKMLWTFIDSFYPGNSRLSISLLKQVSAKEPPEFTFAMLARHLKDLYWTKISNEMPYPSWKITKLKRQASRFSAEQLKIIISKLAKIDIKSKSSQENLYDLLAFLIATKLE